MAIGQFMPMFAAFGGFEPDPFDDYVVMSLDMDNLVSGAPVDKSNMPTAFAIGGAPLLDGTNTLFGKPTISFSGTGQYFYQARPTEAYYDLSASGDFCVDFWFKMQIPALAAWNTLVSHKTSSSNNEPQVYIDTAVSGGKYRLVLNVANASRVTSGYIVEPGKWHHVSYGRSAGNRWFLYVDGVLIGTYTNTSAMATMSCTIGTSGWQRSTNSTDKFRGNIASFRWWNGVSPRDGINNFSPPRAPWGKVTTEFTPAEILSGRWVSGVEYLGFWEEVGFGSISPRQPFPSFNLSRANSSSNWLELQSVRLPQNPTSKELLRLNCVTPIFKFRNADSGKSYTMPKFVLSNMAYRSTTGGSVGSAASGIFVNGEITYLEAVQ